MAVKEKLRHLKYANESGFRLISGVQQFSFRTQRHVNEVINCGTPRSGSTLLNLIINSIHLYSLRNEQHYVDTGNQYLKKLNSSTPYNLIKVHNYLPLVHKRVKAGKAVGFFTHRDIRDVVVSLMQKGWITNFDEYVERRNLHKIVLTALVYAKCPNMHVFSYNDLLTEKEEVIKRVSTALIVSLGQDEIEGIIRDTSLESVNKNINQMDTVNIGTSECNPTTGLHKNHIADGRIGKWKEFLTKDQVNTINKIAADYDNYFNYQYTRS